MSEKEIKIDKIIEASGIYLDSEKIIAKEVLLLDINLNGHRE